MTIGRNSMNKKKKMDEDWDSFLPFHSQWYWTRDWLNKKCKAWYHGPLIDWMHLADTNEKKDTDKKDREEKTLGHIPLG